MKLEILQVGNPILHKESKRVVNIDDSIRTLCSDMIETMYANNGVGLSAPQVGILKRIVVFDENGSARVLINPEIRDTSETRQRKREGCLSVPNLFLSILRYDSVHIRYRTLEGKPKYETFTDLSAHIIQHEIDHLDGMLLTDYKYEKTLDTLGESTGTKSIFM